MLEGFDDTSLRITTPRMSLRIIRKYFYRRYIWILLHISLTSIATAIETTITIGGLFEYDVEENRFALEHALRMLNSRTDILSNFRLKPDVEMIPSRDSFAASKGVCRQLHDGIAVVIGPMYSESAGHVQSICDAVEMPHVQTLRDLAEHSDMYSINLFPYYISLGQAHLDFILHQGWTSFTILYDNEDGLIRMQELIKATGTYGNILVSFRKLDAIPENSDDYRITLKEIRNRGETRIVLDCDWNKVRRILSQATSINMTMQYYHYMLTSLDIELIDLDSLRHSGANITAFRILDPTSPVAVNVTNDRANRRQESSFLTGGDARLATSTALIYDAVQLFALALDELSRARDVRVTSLSCKKPRPWEHGNSLINYMKMTQFDGLTGQVRFDERGTRTDFNLDLMELTMDGLAKIGSWNGARGINITKQYSEIIEEVADLLKNKTLVVTTIIEKPYVMLKHDPNGSLHGNDRFEGFCVDLIAEISNILGFNYTLRLVEDGKYGAPVGPSEEWNGMVRELMDKRADLAVASLTISFIRQKVIDFTKPFMTLGISILFKKPVPKNPQLFSFLSPLHVEIWISMLVAYVIVSFTLFVLARFSPYEWYNPHPCNEDSDVVENQFTLINSLWFTVGSLMQQGSEVAPRALSTRIVSGIWWFFTLILISSYTANLAAFLTVERMKSPIENAEDLSKQRDIKYGTLYGGSTMTFFEKSQIEIYKRMWMAMNDFTPSVFVNSTEDGIRQVKHGLGKHQYAFLLESRMNEYITQRNCDLMQVGGLLDSKGYGIGTPRGSPYRDLISDAILQLQEAQKIQMLIDMWWKERHLPDGKCDASEEKVRKDANALTIGNVGGVFVVLAVGLTLSPFVAIFEYVWRSKKDFDKVDHEKSTFSEMCEALNFAFSCSADTVTKSSHLRKTNGSQGGDEGRGRSGIAPAHVVGEGYVDHEYYGLPLRPLPSYHTPGSEKRVK